MKTYQMIGVGILSLTSMLGCTPEAKKETIPPVEFKQGVVITVDSEGVITQHPPGPVIVKLPPLEEKITKDPRWGKVPIRTGFGAYTPISGTIVGNSFEEYREGKVEGNYFLLETDNGIKTVHLLITRKEDYEKAFNLTRLDPETKKGKELKFSIESDQIQGQTYTVHAGWIKEPIQTPEETK